MNTGNLFLFFKLVLLGWLLANKEGLLLYPLCHSFQVGHAILLGPAGRVVPSHIAARKAIATAFVMVFLCILFVLSSLL